MGMGVNPYPPVYMGDPMGLFLCRGYGYGVVIPGGYLPIAISNCSVSGAPLMGSSALPRTVAHCSSEFQLLQATVARSSRCSAGALDSPVNYSGARPEKPESGELETVRSWCTGHCEKLESGTPDSPVRQTRAHSVSLLL
jgi:hypothetical protein